MLHGHFHICWVSAHLLVCMTASAEDVKFQRDVRPILSDACFQCHGADESNRQANLRLDRRAGLFSKRDGRTIVVPGQPQASELIRRITSTDLESRMPPHDAERPLRPREIQIL